MGVPVGEERSSGCAVEGEERSSGCACGGGEVQWVCRVGEERSSGCAVSVTHFPVLFSVAVTPPGKAREDWKIIRALSEVLLC